MHIEIKSIYGETLFQGDFPDMSTAVQAAVSQKVSLSGADLSRADLSRADLSRADLWGADLSGADLSRADLWGADLSGADRERLYSRRTILPEGDLIGYKKLGNGTVAKLRIPADAKRVGGMTGRKCRAEFAIVLEGEGTSKHDPTFHYAPGATVRPGEPFDDNPLDECLSGIHFFITRAEAEAY